MPEAGFDPRCKRHHGTSNGVLHFSACSIPMLPSVIPSFEQEDQRKGNEAFICEPLCVARDSFPSTFNALAHLKPDDPLDSEFHGFFGLNDMGSWHQGPPMPINDARSLNYAGSYPLSC